MKKLEIFLLVLFFLFSCWLMNKSFGWSPETGQFRIARHQVGDFGLHLSLIRSFSWGNNWPPELPHFPGRPLAYHYYFDFFVGVLERLGLRLDYAFNGLSIIAFTALLFLIYQLSQTIFGKNKILGLLSVIFFLFSSSLGFVDFFRQGQTLRDFWFLPDYLHKGPFDGSLISIFFTPNVWLNQRHLVAGLAISLAILNFIIKRLFNDQPLAPRLLVGLGLILGLSSRIHTLNFFGTGLVLFFLFLFSSRGRSAPGRHWRRLGFIFLPAGLIFLPHGLQILNQDLNHSFWRPGFLASGLGEWFKFWFLNFGLACLTIPAGFWLSSQRQRKVFFSFLPLFIIGNLFQLGFRIDHNHSLFNLFFLLANFYTAWFLIWLWQKRFLQKVIVLGLLALLTFSGGLNLMAVKNDFQLSFPEESTRELMVWIRQKTDPVSVFLAPAEILDPVTLAGRFNYCGADYYLEVMGYNENYMRKRSLRASSYNSSEQRKADIDYLLVSVESKPDFSQENLELVYQNNDWLVFRL